MKAITKQHRLKIVFILSFFALFVNYTNAQLFFNPPAVTPTIASNDVPIVVHGVASGNGTGVAFSYGGGGIYIGKGAGASTFQNGYNLAIGNAVSHTNPVSLDFIPLASLQALSTTSGPNMANFNLAIGTSVLRSITTNSNNTGIGQNGTLFSLTDGDGNTAMGAASMIRFGTGSNNAAFGISALAGPVANSSGSSNTAMGSGALAAINGGSFNVGLGAGANVPNGANSNQLSIQNSIFGTGMGGATPRIGINVNAPANTLHVNGTARITQVPKQSDDWILCVTNVSSTLAGGEIHARPFPSIPPPPECMWELGTSDDQNLTMGHSGCRKGFTSIGADDGYAASTVAPGNSKAKLYVYNPDEIEREDQYAIGAVSVSGNLDNTMYEVGPNRIGVYGYGHGYKRSIGVYGVADFFCEDVETRKNANIGVYGGPKEDNMKACEDNNSFFAGYFAGELVGGATPIIVSDERLKTKIEDLQNVEEIISKLAPKTFFFRQNTGSGFAFPKEKQYGFISQEVEKILPDVVKEIPGPVTMDEKGNMKASDQTYKGMQYEALIAILVKAVQNQNEKIAGLESLIKGKAAIQENDQSKSSVQQVMLNDNNIQQVVLYQNVPNPFSEKTTIAYEIPGSSKDAEIRFYNTTGYLIKAAQLVNKGKGSVEVFGSGVATGVYTYVLYVDGKIMANKKMIKQ